MCVRASNDAGGCPGIAEIAPAWVGMWAGNVQALMEAELVAWVRGGVCIIYELFRMRREKLREMRDEMRPFAGLGWDTLQDGNCVVSAPASDAVTVVVIPTSMACPNPAQAACWAGPLLFPTGKEVRGKGARSPLGVSPNSGFQVQRRRQRPRVSPARA